MIFEKTFVQSLCHLSIYIYAGKRYEVYTLTCECARFIIILLQCCKIVILGHLVWVRRSGGHTVTHLLSPAGEARCGRLYGLSCPGYIWYRGSVKGQREQREQRGGQREGHQHGG